MQLRRWALATMTTTLLFACSAAPKEDQNTSVAAVESAGPEFLPLVCSFYTGNLTMRLPAKELYFESLGGGVTVDGLLDPHSPAPASATTHTERGWYGFWKTGASSATVSGKLSSGATFEFDLQASSPAQIFGAISVAGTVVDFTGLEFAEFTPVPGDRVLCFIPAFKTEVKEPVVATAPFAPVTSLFEALTAPTVTEDFGVAFHSLALRKTVTGDTFTLSCQKVVEPGGLALRSNCDVRFPQVALPDAVSGAFHGTWPLPAADAAKLLANLAFDGDSFHARYRQERPGSAADPSVFVSELGIECTRSAATCALSVDVH